MSAQELLARLDALGVNLAAVDGRLKVNAARGALDESLRQSIASHKGDLLDLLSRRDRAEPSLQPLARNADLPLSFFQERLWVLQQLDPSSTDYLIAASWPVPTVSTPAEVVAAVERAQERHESLRTLYIESGGSPCARLVPAESVTLHDLSALPAEEQRRWVTEELHRAVHTPLDVTSGPAVRFAVVALGAGSNGVILVAHHIAVDAWSIGLLRAEIDGDLLGEVRTRPSLQYADFAAWQRRSQDPAAVASELDWWSSTLAGAPALSAFPAERQPAKDRSSPEQLHGATLDFVWDAELSSALREFVRSEGATVYMALLAACAALLRAHTGQGDVVLGSPMGLRERPEFEAMVGPFINLLMVRLDLSDDPTFTELLNRARDGLLDAHAHRQVPFETLLERLKPARSFDHGPLFQVAVVQHNATPRGDLALLGGGALHDLTWYVHELEGRYAGSVEYRTALYGAEEITRLIQQLQQFLRSALVHPSKPISHLSLLDAAERGRVLHEFNATERALDVAPFIRQFERQAAAAPERVALRHAGESLPYGELNSRANRLARRLRTAGVAPGVRVAVCLQRTPALIAALLAVQKSGGAYVPLDPDFPAERLAYMLADSGARVLLASRETALGLESPPGLIVIDPCSDQEEQAGDGNDLDDLGSPSDPAYVIYTSGSTGRPKGVAVPHKALANFLGSMRSSPGLTPDDVVAAITTISFDIACLELYLPLVVGACIELVPRDTAVDGAALAACVAAAGATVMQATPATWRMLLDVDWRPSRPLRAFCGGEGLPRDLADDLLGRVAELWNLYGPTETTVWSSIARVAPSPAPITIGRPIANTQMYVLSAAREPLPVGVAGELWIGGEGVALEYHGRPELTAERFVSDPFSARPGARLYRTGDLARWDREGLLHHLGRIDHQVKIRGYRIELGEIESVLGSLAQVRQTVVVAREAAPGDVRLIAYVVYAPGADLVPGEVRRLLRQELPEYMLPAVILALNALPLTPNGKVDRAALPDPFREPAQTAAEVVAPEPGLEETIAAVWRDVLKLQNVGAHDNFFELGGHSLLSLRVAAAVERVTGWRMDPRLLFFQTLRQVAAAAALGLAPDSAPGASPANGATLARVAGPVPAARMTPLFFGSPDRRLFGVYSPRVVAADRRRSRGVVLCSAQGNEHERAHRSMVLLARRLQAAGFDVLRFDYYGTGDSAGDADFETPTAWLADVHTAVDELRNLAGVDEFVLIGLRLGALLATEVASVRQDVRALLLWDPVAEMSNLRLVEPPSNVRHLALLSTQIALPATFAAQVVAGPSAWVEAGRDGVGALPVQLLNRAVEWVSE